MHKMNYLTKLLELETQTIKLLKSFHIPLANEKESYPNRDILEKIIAKDNSPSLQTKNVVAMNLIDNYCSVELPHKHDENGHIIPETFPEEWMRKIHSLMVNNIEGAWAKYHMKD